MALDAQEEDNNIMQIAERLVDRLHYVSAVEFAERVEREVSFPLFILCMYVCMLFCLLFMSFIRAAAIRERCDARWNRQKAAPSTHSERDISQKEYFHQLL